MILYLFNLIIHKWKIVKFLIRKTFPCGLAKELRWSFEWKFPYHLKPYSSYELRSELWLSKLYDVYRVFNSISIPYQYFPAKKSFEPLFHSKFIGQYNRQSLIFISIFQKSFLRCFWGNRIIFLWKYMRIIGKSNF